MSSEEEIKRLADEVSVEGTRLMREAKAVNEAVPFIQKTLDISRQFQQTFNITLPNTGFYNWDPVREPLQQIRNKLASISIGTGVLGSAISGAAMSNSAGTSMVVILSSATKDSDPGVTEWANKNILLFEQLQTSQANIEFIRQKLATLYLGGEREFDEALNEYSKAVNAVALSSNAALAMRNVMESLNGRLLQLARRYAPMETTIKNWNDAAVWVARGGPTSFEASRLQGQESVYDDLHNKKLTPIVKNDRQPLRAEWEAVYAQFLGFLFTVLGLIDLKDGA